MYQGFQFFCLINCLPCNKQFRTFHLGIRYTVLYICYYKRGISLILSALFWVFHFVVFPSNTSWIITYRFFLTLFCKLFFVVTIANFKYCFEYTKVNFFFITRNVCRDICLADNTLSNTLSV